MLNLCGLPGAHESSIRPGLSSSPVSSRPPSRPREPPPERHKPPRCNISESRRHPSSFPLLDSAGSTQDIPRQRHHRAPLRCRATIDTPFENIFGHSPTSARACGQTMVGTTSQRPRESRSRRHSEVMELRGPEMANIRRWDGAARACEPWDSLGKVGLVCPRRRCQKC